VLLVAFCLAAVVSYLGVHWNLQETRWAFPPGTKVILVATFLLAVLVRCLGRTPWWITAVVVALGVLVGGAVPQIAEMVGDPTSNNLWPIGMAMMGSIALTLSLAGVGVGSVLLRLGRRKP